MYATSESTQVLREVFLGKFVMLVSKKQQNQTVGQKEAIMKRQRIASKIIVFVVMVLGILPRPCEAEKRVFSLNDVLKVAINRNPGITATRHQAEAVDAMVAQATAAYFPQLSNTTNYFRVGGDLPDAIGGIAARTSASGYRGEEFDLNSPLNVYNTNFFVSQYLYDFGKTSGRLEQTRHDLTAAQKKLDTTMASVIRDVKNKYFEVLKKLRLVEVQKESLEMRNKYLEQARALHKSGIRPKIDVTKGLVERAKAKLKLVKAKFSVRTAKVELENLLGGRPVEGEYSLSMMISSPPAPTDVDPLIQEAVGLRPEIASLRAQLKAAEALLRVAESGYWPSISANGGYGWLDTKFPLKDYWLGGVSLRWEFFSGFKTKAEEREARARLAKLKAELRQEELSVIREVSQAFISVLESAETIGTAEVALEEARENMELADGRYRAGMSDAIEFADAELILTEAKSDLVQARYKYLQAYADLERAVGGGVQFAEVSPEKDAHAK